MAIPRKVNSPCVMMADGRCRALVVHVLRKGVMPTGEKCELVVPN